MYKAHIDIFPVFIFEHVWKNSLCIFIVEMLLPVGWYCVIILDNVTFFLSIYT